MCDTTKNLEARIKFEALKGRLEGRLDGIKAMLRTGSAAPVNPLNDHREFFLQGFKSDLDEILSLAEKGLSSGDCGCKLRAYDVGTCSDGVQGPTGQKSPEGLPTNAVCGFEGCDKLATTVCAKCGKMICDKHLYRITEPVKKDALTGLPETPCGLRMQPREIPHCPACANEWLTRPGQ